MMAMSSEDNISADTATSMSESDIENFQMNLIPCEWLKYNFSQVLNISMDSFSISPCNISTTQTQRASMPILAILTFFYVLIFVAGILGNLITCIVISRNKFMHTATNFYLFNLAVSDLILLLSGMPQELYTIWFPDSYPFTDVPCVLESVLSETAANATVLTITAFTVERYIAICHPFRQHTMSKLSRAVKFIFAIWIAAFLLALPQAMQFSVVSQGLETSCTMNNGFIAHVFAVSGFIFFGGPMTAICVLYVLIGLKLKRSRLLQAQPRRCFDVNRGLSAQSRVIRMLVAVAVTFFLCWAPFHAQRLMAVYGSTSNIHSKVFSDIFHIVDYISGVLYFLSTCINPLLYNLMSHKFREAFKVTLARHFGLANSYQTQHHNYSALLRKNGSMRLHTTVNNNALEHFSSYRAVHLHCRDPSNHLSLQDSIRTTTTNSGTGGCSGLDGTGSGGNNSCHSSTHRNRCVSLGSQATLQTSLSKNDVFTNTNRPPNAGGGVGGEHRMLQTQVSQPSSLGDANSLLDADLGMHTHSHNYARPIDTFRLKDLGRTLANKRARNGSKFGRQMTITTPTSLNDNVSLDNTQASLEYNVENLSKRSLSNETEFIKKAVIIPAAGETKVVKQSKQYLDEFNNDGNMAGQPSRSRLKLSRIIINRRDRHASKPSDNLADKFRWRHKKKTSNVMRSEENSTTSSSSPTSLSPSPKLPPIPLSSPLNNKNFKT